MPLRTCIVTREKRDKSELIRLTVVNETIKIDNKKLESGRGIYLLPDFSVLEDGIKKGKIAHMLKLKRKLTGEEIEQLKIDFNKEALNKTALSSPPA